ncbi:MAG: acyl-[acyl-carrier-protein]-phospholipid O-acyltransferase [Gammaproteobacteria bacterium]|jgi:acyl-[acyl-carrier-protein]-phospholipid O-acyltransferase/long-chain-fatty-acid--[acyl-carrier-protein] ligase
MNSVLRLIRACARVATKCLFRVQILGIEHAKTAGGRTLIVANHISRLDGLFLFLFLPEVPTFAISPATAKSVWVRPFLRFVNSVEVDPLSPHALKRVIKVLQDNESALIFPEGRITTTGSLMKIYEGPALMAALCDANILPVGIEGLQYSRFSLLKTLVRRRWFPPVRITILAPRKISFPDELLGHARRTKAAAAMLHMMREIAYENAYEPVTLYRAILNASARHGPNRTIIEDATGVKLTYRQLLIRANVLSQFIAKDSEPGEHIGIMLPSTAAAIVTFTAVLSCGRTAAMLNFTAGQRGLRIACETAGIKIVYTSRKFISEAGLEAEATAVAAISTLIYLEDLRDAVTSLQKARALVVGLAPVASYAFRQRVQDPHSDCVILFTSGSEGIPKGVVLTHSNIIANRSQVQTLLALTHEDTVLNVLPMFHAFGLLGGTLIPLFDGAKIYCYPSPLHYRVIPELSYQLGATCLFGTNTFLAGYAEHGNAYDFHKMRFVIAGAEKLTAQTRRIWGDKFGIRVFEGYGATEASPVICVNTPMGNTPDSVGQLLAAMEYYLEPVEGIATGGRLVVRGPNIMRGYLFHGGDGICYPPSTDYGQGWYDTGDIVTVDANGFVALVGRQKRFAKIGGEMVSLVQTEEIAQLAWPEVMSAAVSLPSSRKGEQILLLCEDRECDRRVLVATAKKLGLPELSLPKRVIFCETIPLLGSGKVDYPAVREIAKELSGL